MDKISNSLLLVLLAVLPDILSGQSSEGSSSVYPLALLIIIGALILVSVLLLLSESFIAIEGRKFGINTEETKSIFGGVAKPSYAREYPMIRLKKGHDILLQGGVADNTIKSISHQTRYALRPQDFRSLAPIPRVVVSIGDEVKAGDVLFYDKKLERVKFVAPVSGEVVEIRRGEKRAITDIVVLADKDIQYKQFNPPSLSANREVIVDFLLESGVWPLINQRPFDITADPDVVPANIFISTFNSAPLALDSNAAINGNEEAFQYGLDTLAKLTSGTVHLGLSANGEAPHDAFLNARGVQKTFFQGKHPSGNVGVQIHHAAPIRTGQTVWTLSVQDVITIGTLMYKGIYDASRVIAVVGSKILEPKLIKTRLGANINELVQSNISSDKRRIIAGDVLTGQAIEGDAFMPMNCDQITAIAEGDYYEMFGWLLPIKPRPTISKTFPNFLFPDLKFEGDTNTHGEQRAFVVTGEYEKVLPMNLYPQQLMKAILANDYEQMEGLGINELSEEDIALCEFVCTSKIPLQRILRQGLDMVREQG